MLKENFIDGEYLYAGTTSENDKLNGITHTINNKINSHLGEIKMFALSISNAVTKASLQEDGWAICDGTTPSSQGITNATITTTPDLQHKFIRMSNDESSGGSFTEDYLPLHNHSILANANSEFVSLISTGSQSYYNTSTEGNKFIQDKTSGTPIEAYELVYFIKVK